VLPLVRQPADEEVADDDDEYAHRSPVLLRACGRPRLVANRGRSMMSVDSPDGSTGPPVLCACSRPRLVAGAAVRAAARDGDGQSADVVIDVERVGGVTQRPRPTPARV